MAKMNLSAKYLNKINSLLRNIFDYAIKNYDLPYNPVVKSFKTQNKIIEDKDKIRYITKEEFDKFIAKADNEMYKLLFMFLFYTGCRIGEVICLTWNDINLERKFVSITKTLYKIHDNKPTTNKTNKNRQVSIPDVLLLELANYKAIKKEYKDFSNDWYVFGDVKTLSTTQIARKKHQYFLESGVKEITIHEFRHSHISNLCSMYLQNGGKDYVGFLQKLSVRCGHTLDVMTRTYMHLFPNTQDEIVDMLNKI
jgi:integrase